MKVAKFAFVVLITASVLIPSYSVRADIAPPSQPSGSNVVPGEVTMVQMLSERVVIDLRPPWSDGIDADVTADFVMRNQGTVEEHMTVGFPMSTFDNQNYDGSISKLKDLKVKVNSLDITPEYTNEDKWLSNGEQDVGNVMDWAIFNLVFPVGKDVFIEVNYKQPPKYDAPTTEYDYTLITGAGWYGPIGKGDIIFRLPYTISKGENYFVGASEDKQDWLNSGIIVENEARWHFENLEPERDWSVNVIRPRDWESVLSARQALIKNQYDAKLWLELGEAYSYSTVEAGGKMCHHSDAAIMAYQQSVALKPDWADAHALLAQEYYCAYWDSNFALSGPDQNLQQAAFQELSVALALDPNNQAALDLKNNLSEGPNVTLPPPTPYATPTIDLNVTPSPTETPVIVALIPTKLVYAPTSTTLPKPKETIIPTSTVVSTGAQREANSSFLVFGALGIFVVGLGSGWLLSKRSKK